MHDCAPVYNPPKSSPMPPRIQHGPEHLTNAIPKVTVVRRANSSWELFAPGEQTLTSRRAGSPELWELWVSPKFPRKLGPKHPQNDQNDIRMIFSSTSDDPLVAFGSATSPGIPWRLKGWGHLQSRATRRIQQAKKGDLATEPVQSITTCWPRWPQQSTHHELLIYPPSLAGAWPPLRIIPAMQTMCQEGG